MHEKSRYRFNGCTSNVGGEMVPRRHRALLHAPQSQTVHQWVEACRRYWIRQIDRIKERAEKKAMDRIARENKPTQNPKK